MSLKDKPVRPVRSTESNDMAPTVSSAEQPAPHNRKPKDKDKDRSKDKDGEHHERKKQLSKLSALNAELVAHGYTKRSLKLEALATSDQAQIASAISDLLSSSSAKVNALEDANARLKTLQYEHDRLAKQLDKNDHEVSRMESDVQAARLQTANAERKQQEEEVKVKVLREDVARGRKALENMKTAATQEAKRAQLKLDKVLGQLARTVPVVPPTFELMNPVPASNIAPVAAGPIPLIEASLTDLSALRQSLQEEIDAFRHVAVSTANSLRDALATARGEDTPRRLVADEFYALDRTSKHVRQLASWNAHPVIADTRLKALVADVRRELLVDHSPVMRDGNGATEAEAEAAEEARRAERAREREMSDLHNRVKDLELELEIAAAKNNEANKVVEQMAKLSVGAGVPSTTDFADERLREELVRQKRELDVEREGLRDCRVRMGEERLALDADRASFAKDKEAAIAAAVAEAVAAAAATAVAPPPVQQPAALHSPPRQTYAQGQAHKHNPPSPSPLSPHKRTPTKHTAATAGVRRKAPRTPLSRLVLERAVLERDNNNKKRKISNPKLGLGGSRLGSSSRPSSAVPSEPAGAPASPFVSSASTSTSAAGGARPPFPSGSSAASVSASTSASAARRSASPPFPLMETARDNIFAPSSSSSSSSSAAAATAAAAGKKRESDPARPPSRGAAPPQLQPPKPQPARSSNLFANTAASAARAKVDKVLGNGARAPVGPNAPKARVWR